MELHVAHFLICRAIWYDHAKPELGFSLGGVFTHIEPPGGAAFPLRMERVFAYVSYWGEPGEYRFRIRVVRVESHGYDEEEEIPLGLNGEHRDFFWPSQRSAELTGLNNVDELSFHVGPIPIAGPGTYEFQLFLEDEDVILARERILARD